VFQSEDIGQAVVTGSIDILYGEEKRSASFVSATDASIGGILRGEIGKPFSVSLKSDDYELLPGGDFAFSRDVIPLSVKLKPTAPYAGAVFVNGVPAQGATVTLFGLPCTTRTGRSGYFEFRDCPQSRRLEAAKLALTLPTRASPCTSQFPLYAPPRLTAVDVDEGCNRFDVKPMAPTPPNHNTGSVCQTALIDEIKNRLRTDHLVGLQSCSLDCHVRVTGGLAYSSPGGLEFRAPVACADGGFTLQASDLFGADIHQTP
jgi:hypothetical protein